MTSEVPAGRVNCRRHPVSLFREDEMALLDASEPWPISRAGRSRSSASRRVHAKYAGDHRDYIALPNSSSPSSLR